MQRRALLIGSQTGGLYGVHADVELMGATLGALGFSAHTITRRDASRRGILGAYRELIESTASGDAALVYYSGHGGRYPNPMAREEPDQPAYLQYIVPTDYDDARGDEFNGILAEELSLLQWELTAKTDNVTTILDCCHSARMSRDPSLVPKGLPRRGPFAWQTLTTLYRDVREAFPATADVDSNPLAVRVVACAPEQSAYELDLPAQGRHGALTATLAGLLRDSPAARLTWRQILEALGPAVMDLVVLQRPEIEGPADRYVFATEERDATGVFPISVEGATAYLEASPLFGIGEGDTYAIVAVGGDPGSPLARAVVEATIDGRAVLALTEGRIDALPEGAEAHPLEVALGRRPVVIGPVDASGYEQVASALSGSAHIRIGDEGEPGAVASVDLTNGALQLRDGQGEPMFVRPRELTDGNVALLKQNLLQLARAAHLRDLPSGTGAAALRRSVTVEYIRLEGSDEIPLPASGEHLFESDRLVVRLRNDSGERRFVSVFDIGLKGAITLLSTAEPSGLSLADGDVYELYRTPAGLTGIELYWPPELPREGPRPETIVIIVSDRPQDLRGLVQAGVRSGAARRGEPPSGLQRLVEEVDAGTRDARPQAVEVVPYSVERFDFMLHPGQRVDDSEPRFELDERPDRSLRMIVPRGPADVPAQVALRIPELVVHSNRAFLRASVRVDAMVVTRLESVAGRPYHATTARFDRIRDGDRLPLDNLLVYEGPVADFLDLAIWVARDDQRGLDLAELFDQQANDEQVTAAVAALVGLAVAAPHAAAAAATVAAVATLVRVGAKLIDAAVDKSIGIYRTSLLPHERFGAGEPSARHPAAGLLRAQDVSLAYEVVAS